MSTTSTLTVIEVTMDSFIANEIMCLDATITSLEETRRDALASEEFDYDFFLSVPEIEAEIVAYKLERSARQQDLQDCNV